MKAITALIAHLKRIAVAQESAFFIRINASVNVLKTSTHKMGTTPVSINTAVIYSINILLEGSAFQVAPRRTCLISIIMTERALRSVHKILMRTFKTREMNV